LELAFSTLRIQRRLGRPAPGGRHDDDRRCGVRVACLGDVITSKEAAGRDKDFQALPHLIHFRQKQQKLDGGR
jgi:hypothetical protein